MTSYNFFSKETFNNYLKKIRSEKNTLKSEIMANSLKSWLLWLKDKRHISVAEYNKSISQLKDFPKNDIENLPAEFNGKEFTNLFEQNVSPTYFYLFIFISILFNIFFFYRIFFFGNDSKTNERVGRVLPFKGSIKEADGTVLDTKRDVVFRIYNNPTDGNILFEGKCVGESGIEPTFNGTFTILIGSDCGMKPIPEEYFSNNDTLYLGITIGTDQELIPRHQIFTSTLAKDTGMLQGLTLGKTVSSIPFINENGIIEIETDTPILKSTQGQFTIEANTLLLKSTEENGSIMIDPALGGNVIMTTGRLGIGTFTPNSILDITGSSLFNSVASISNTVTEDDENTSVLKLNLGTSEEGTESQFIEFYAGSSDENSPGVKVGDIKLNNGSVVYETTGADFAEYFSVESNESISIYNIVSISSEGIHKSQPNEKIVGVVSNTAGFIGNNIYNKNNSILVGLVGQVDVYISTLNGPIETGDRVGASIIPGYGGKVSETSFSVGYALENLESNNVSNNQCPNSYKKLRDYSGRKVRCGIIKILLDLD